jgi:predicted anti-sigma-YlaC factor YlaD
VSARNLVELTCQQVVELVTDHLEGSLDEHDRVVFEQHLFGCTWCMTYLKQIKRTIELTGQVKQPEAVDVPRLSALFQGWKGGK